MRSTVVLFTFLSLLLSFSVAAQEMTPRAYWPAPTGTRVLTLGASYARGDIIPDPSLPIVGLNSEITTAYVGYLQTLNLFGRSANLIFELPYSSGDTKSEFMEHGLIGREYQGAGDMAATLSVNLMGAPAMTKADFAQLRMKPRPIIGASLKVVAPTGRYDETRIVNVGSNRWAAKAELGSILALSRKWLLEAEVGAWVFGDNDDFLGMTREQDSIYSLEVHLVHRFGPGFWGSLDVNGYRGGRSTVNDRRLDDLQRDSKVGATLVFPFAPGRAIKASYSMGSVNNSDESFDLYQLSYQHLF